MKLIGLISPNLSEDTLVDVYRILPEGIRIEGRALNVGKYTEDEFNRAEQAFADLVRDLARCTFLRAYDSGSAGGREPHRIPGRNPQDDSCCAVLSFHNLAIRA